LGVKGKNLDENNIILNLAVGCSIESFEIFNDSAEATTALTVTNA